LNSYLATKSQVEVVLGNGQRATAPVAGSLAFQALKDMLQQKALLQMAKDEGVAPTEEDVKKELEFQKKLDPDYVKKRRSLGYTLEQINKQLEVALAHERLVTKGITISKDEVDQYIANNKQLFREPETVDMQWIFVRTREKLDKVEDELRKGAIFASVAQQYGEQPRAKEDGGRFTSNRVLDRFPVELKNLINKTEVGRVTNDTSAAAVKGWTKLNDGFAKFYVERKTPAKDITIDETRRKLVERQLAMERGAAATNLDMRLADRLVEAKVAIEDKLLKEQWERFVKDLKERKGVGTETASR
ncbi:MAG TPA: peptidyl-prolyl cis-trans isomerase, partial [Fimbriimonadaceae bacterium]|nr:peptidyl-prolyl cis-trans isomerase [Fimbriimonadaceae bacterium]